MWFEDLILMLKTVGFDVHETEYNGILWICEEHCYTAYPDKEGETEVFDSEGELPEDISQNLEALRWYFSHELLRLRIEEVLYPEGS